VIVGAFRLRSGGRRARFKGGQVGEAEPGRRARRADPADEHAEPALLGGEDMLNGDPDPRLGGVAAGDVGRNQLPARLGAL
jgi:hypothetical protein